MKVSGLGNRYVDKVLNAEEGVLKDGIQTFPDRTDRVYLNAEACSVIHDDVLQRNIDVIHRHHGNVVARNPGPALSVSMGDMPDDGYKNFRLRGNLLRDRTAESQRRETHSPGADHSRCEALRPTSARRERMAFRLSGLLKNRVYWGDSGLDP